MSIKPSLEKLKAEIETIRRKLMEIGPMHPGSISMQYQVCGNPGCKCMHPKHPQRHGPYPKLSFTRRGQRVCRFVRAESVEELQPRLEAYRQFRKLTDRWIALSIEIGKIEFFSRNR